MSTLVKVGVVLGGYAVAFAAAWGIVYIRQLHRSECDARASAGMYAWGDLMLFVAAFGLLALIPTGLGLYSLRPYEKFWTVLAIFALVVAATGPVGACLSALALNLHLQKSAWELAGDLGFLRAMGAPLMVMGFLTCAALAPSKRSRWALLVATGLECAASAYFVVHMWLALP